MATLAPKNGKKYVGTWITKKLHADLRRVARRESRSISWLLERAVREIVGKAA